MCKIHISTLKKINIVNQKKIIETKDGSDGKKKHALI